MSECNFIPSGTGCPSSEQLNKAKAQSDLEILAASTACHLTIEGKILPLKQLTMGYSLRNGFIIIEDN